jgi:hypothetical protein
MYHVYRNRVNPREKEGSVKSLRMLDKEGNRFPFRRD